SIAQALSDVLEKSHDDQSYASSVASQLNDRTLIWERDAAVANIIGVLDGKLCASWNPPILYKAEPVIAPADDNAAVRAFCRQQLPSEDRNLW
ncbi:hypothetical protein GTY49_40860, partial [Streptomyces sp. SID5477]|nr:hypothetical protein [Streptomyces sp. SID5477]